MDHLQKLEALIKKQNGTVLSSDLDKLSIPRIYLAKLVKEKKLERVSWGIYTQLDTIEDEMYILQKKYKKFIFSHETALFLHDLSDRTPLKYCVTVPSGTKISKKLSDRLKIYYIKGEYHILGVIETQTALGNPIKIYNSERTICDILRSKSRIDQQIFSDALKRFGRSKQIDFYLLSDYSNKFKGERTLRTYIELIL
ncbi:MAG: abortive phage infection protein [Erysipelotrichaceae bacterium]|nr:abortive phage infection protein [Erysipelotrichaceae bacterium]